MRSILLATLCVSAVLLAACGPKPVATVSGGECKAFARAAIEVCGLTQADQDIVDDYVEAGVQACQWRRPQPRTPSCTDLRDEIATLRARAVAAPVMAQSPASSPKKKPIWRRVLGR